MRTLFVPPNIGKMLHNIFTKKWLRSREKKKKQEKERMQEFALSAAYYFGETKEILAGICQVNTFYCEV